MNSLPSLRALQVFEAVGRFGGIVEAARRLGISAGAVSQQMKLLEDTLGLSLTHKVGKRIRLTVAGQRYHESCAAAFESLRIAQTEVERSKHASNLRISALPSMPAMPSRRLRAMTSIFASPTATMSPLKTPSSCTAIVWCRC